MISSGMPHGRMCAGLQRHSSRQAAVEQYSLVSLDSRPCDVLLLLGPAGSLFLTGFELAPAEPVSRVHGLQLRLGCLITALSYPVGRPAFIGANQHFVPCVA